MGSPKDSGYTYGVRESFVIVHRSYDPILLELLGELLRGAGLSARVLGTRSAALIGVGPSITELNISVPRSEAAEASEFLEAFFATEGESLLADAGIYDDDDDDDDHRVNDNQALDQEGGKPLRELYAGVGILLPGLGHLYAQRKMTAAILGVAFLVGLMIVSSASNEATMVGGILGLLALLIFDLMGALRAVRQFNCGQRKGAFTQIILAATYVGIAFGFSQVFPVYTDSFSTTTKPGSHRYNHSDKTRIRRALDEQRHSHRPHLFYDYLLPSIQ